MSIRPILFNTEMVRAILDGRKTVTRRKIDAKAVEAALSFQGRDKYEEISDQQFVTCLCTAPCDAEDVLWVRETWNETTHGYNYKASPYGNSRDNYPWHPSIHMPKAAARLFLRVKSVRVERLQEITEDGAEAEGVPCEFPMSKVYCPVCKGEGQIGTFHPVSLGHMDVDYPHCEKATKRFENLWNSTIKPADLPRYGWDANPFVWAIEFERCERPENFLEEGTDHER